MVHESSLELREESINEPLTWNFSPSQRPKVPFEAFLYFNWDIVARIDGLKGGLARIYGHVLSRYNITSIPQNYATLIIFNVTKHFALMSLIMKRKESDMEI